MRFLGVESTSSHSSDDCLAARVFHTCPMPTPAARRTPGYRFKDGKLMIFRE